MRAKAPPCSAWAPRPPSPDGARLAFVSTRGAAGSAVPVAARAGASRDATPGGNARSEAAGGDGALFVELDDKSVNFRGGPVIGTSHVYWFQQHGSEWSNPPAVLAYRGGEVANTNVGEVDGVVVDGDELFAITCTNTAANGAACAQDAWMLYATRLDTGAPEWSTPLATADVTPRPPLVVDAAWIYWTAPASETPTVARRILRAPRDGSGAPVSFAEVAFDESIGGLVLDDGGVDVVITSSANGGDWKMALAPLGADGTIGARIPLGTTSSVANQVVLDASSVYFTLDGDGAYPDQPRTLQRACRDGSNLVTLLTGFEYGTKSRLSVASFAVDASRVYLTSANQILSMPK